MGEVTRRSFMQAMAAALSAVATGSLFVPKRQIDYGIFCSREAWRYDITQPFTMQERTFATDSRIIVETIDDIASVAAEPRKLPNACGLPWDAFDSQGWKPLEKARRLSTTESSECNICFGRGRLGHSSQLGHCTKCDNGWLDGETQCDACNGTMHLGGAICPQCEGKGWCEYGGDVTEFGSLWISTAYAARLKTLGDVEVNTLTGFEQIETPRSWPRGEQDILMFRGDGFRGMLMPLAKSNVFLKTNQ